MFKCRICEEAYQSTNARDKCVLSHRSLAVNHSSHQLELVSDSAQNHSKSQESNIDSSPPETSMKVQTKNTMEEGYVSQTLQFTCILIL